MGSVCGRDSQEATKISDLEQGQSQAFEAKQASDDQNYGHARKNKRWGQVSKLQCYLET